MIIFFSFQGIEDLLFPLAFSRVRKSKRESVFSYLIFFDLNFINWKQDDCTLRTTRSQSTQLFIRWNDRILESYMLLNRISIFIKWFKTQSLQL